MCLKVSKGVSRLTKNVNRLAEYVSGLTKGVSRLTKNVNRLAECVSRLTKYVSRYQYVSMSQLNMSEHQ